MVERPFCDREDVGSIPGRVKPSQTLKIVFAAVLFGAQHLVSRARNGWNIMPCPRDMTARLLDMM